MASNFKIVLGSKTLNNSKFYGRYTESYLKTVTTVFGTQKFETFEDVNNYSKRSLHDYELLRGYWNGYREQNDQGRDEIANLVGGFATTMKTVLDMYCHNIHITYEIDMKSKYRSSTSLSSALGTHFSIAKRSIKKLRGKYEEHGLRCKYPVNQTAI